MLIFSWNLFKATASLGVCQVIILLALSNFDYWGGYILDKILRDDDED